MDSQLTKVKLKPSCTCKLKFGIYPLKCENSNEIPFEEIANDSIDFLGPANSTEKVKVLQKINEIKKDIADYYMDPDCKIIALPNQRVLPKKPSALGVTGNEKHDRRFLDQNAEELLHEQIVASVKELKKESFVMMGFQSQDCLKFKILQAKTSRGKNKFAELNKYELLIKDILDNEDISQEDLNLCIENHKKWRGGNLNSSDSESWLFKQVSYIDIYFH